MTHGLEDEVVAADAAGLLSWLRALPGCPSVTRAVLAACRAPWHGAERPTWLFAEASAAEGIARLRCVACGTPNDVLDSGAHWSYPPMHACRSCAQSMVKVAVGLHAEPSPRGADDEAAVVSWAVVAARCIACGRVEGLTDMHVARVPLDEVIAAL